MQHSGPPILADKYRLIRQLEAGGMGSVWLAEHIHLHSLVAVKLIAKEVARTRAGIQRFLHEARTTAALHSPHIVQILDYGVHEGTPFIAMELLEGESLAARLRRDGPFRNWHEAELILRQVARAVGRAHDAGVVHRDLKPGNIFLIRNEEEEIVKLLDFGIAKMTASSSNTVLASNTRTGEFLGSPSYASPEQLQSSDTLDHRADIWSLGVIAFECLLGRPPFVADTIVGVVLAICSHPLPIPSECGHVPAGFDAWFARACAHDVARRFQSVREAAAELRRVVDGASSGSLRVFELDNVQRTAGQGTRGDVGWPIVPPAPPPRKWGLPMVLTLVAAIPLVLFTLRALAARGTLDVGVLGLGRLPPSAAARTPAPPVPAATGVRVFGEGAGLRLAVDGHEMGPLPQELTKLEPGEHVLRVTGGPRYSAFEQHVVVRAGEVTPIGPLQLAVLEGLATISAGKNADGAEVTLQIGEVRHVLPPLPLRLDVDTAQPHVLIAERPGFAKFEEPLVFPDGQAEKTFEINLSELSANLPSEDAGPATAKESSSPVLAKRRRAPLPSADTEPPRAAWLTITATAPSDVLLDGIALGTTPLEDVTIEPGAHEVTFVHDGERNTERLDIHAGEHKRVAARLESASPSPSSSLPGDGLDPTTVQRTVRRYDSAVRQDCWQRTLDARLPGDPTSARVSAAITVDPSGRVRSVVTSGAPAAYPGLSHCIENEVRTWRFPSAFGETVINVPFVFVTE